MKKAALLSTAILSMAIAVKLIGTPDFMPWGMITAFIGGYCATWYTQL